MAKVLAVSTSKAELEDIKALLLREGLDTMTAIDGAAAEAALAAKPEIVLFDVMRGSAETARTWRLLSDARKEGRFALLALLPDSDSGRPELLTEADDFVLRPYRAVELVVRVKRLLTGRAGSGGRELLRYGNLAIDHSNYEVSVGGKRVALTFKEYELLRFLAENKGKVFNRDTLLNRIWGYDYYGGDRTVDVHVRRLRSKIEDSSHTYIETVRNVGYRFAPSE